MSDGTLVLSPPARPCGTCGLELPPAALACPSCHALVHAAELTSLARTANDHAQAGRHADAIASYRRVLELLPHGAKQRDQVAQRIETLQNEADGGGKKPQGVGSKLAGGSGVALVLWKLKGVLLFALGKAKFVLFGLTKATTFFSMLATFGIYWTLWGWKFAAGLLLSIYVHEMGHVAALKKLGIAASAPMFIPGFGAVVRLKEYPATPREDAICGLAGPLWGLYAALACYYGGKALGSPVVLAVAHVGAQINLFNLIPFGPLDGGRGFNALAKRERWVIAALIVALYLVFQNSLLLLLGGVAGWRAATGSAPEKSDTRAGLLFAFLLATLTMLTAIHVPMSGRGDETVSARNAASAWLGLG